MQVSQFNHRWLAGCRKLYSVVFSWNVMSVTHIWSLHEFLQGDDKLSEVVSMLEQSSHAGCLQSSYLLWEQKRRAAVSFLLHSKISY